MKEHIYIGIIGAGIMGSRHARIYTEMESAVVVGIADIDRTKAQTVADTHGIVHVSTDYHEILKLDEIDAIHVATPDYYHTDPVMDALKAGKHVLVEKPLSTSIEDAQRIVKASQQTGKHVMVNYTHRWAAPYAVTKNIIEDGKLGQPVMVYAKKDDTLWASTEMMSWTEKTSSAGYLSTHDIDLVLWWLDTNVEHVYALGVKNLLQKRNIDTEDAIQALVRFKNGAIGTFESCWVLPTTMPVTTDSYVELVGTKGTIHIDRLHEGLKVATEHNYTYPKLSLGCEIFGKERGGVQMCLEYFVDSLKKGVKPLPDAGNGLKIVKVSKAIQLSMLRGEPVYIDSL